MNTDQKQQGELVRQKIKNAIVWYIGRHGYPPTVREIADLVGLKSTSSVQNHIKRMFEDGEIETDAGIGSPRAIRVPGYRLVDVSGKPPQEKADAFGDKRTVCPNCGESIINYFNRRMSPPHCMMCGQKIDWSAKGDC